MKKIILLLAIAVIFAASCTRSVLIVNPYYDIPVSNSTVIPGNFILIKFANSISNEDSTAVFNGYIFSFGSDGKVTAIKDNQIISGTYIETHTLDNKLELGFYFYNRPFSYLNGNWWITSISDTSIKLSDTSTGGILEFTAQ
ncbi:MAG TPA: hypothetical protein VGG71_09540 [Chitinophagaceae bacterium]